MKKNFGYSNPLILLLSLLIFGSAQVMVSAGDDNRAREVFEEMDNRRKAITYEKSILAMRIIDRRERARVRSMVMYSFNDGDESKSLTVFREPADVRGTGFLNLSDGAANVQYLYLPALGRVQSIAGSRRSERFMGSDFTYEDLGNQSIGELTFELIEETESEIVVKAIPEDESQYAYIHYTIDLNKYVLLQADYYNEDGEKIKELTAEGYREVRENIWRSDRMIMRDLKENRRTELEWSERVFDEPIPDRYFTERHLTRGLQ